ncbi:flagellar basal body P-ring formation chaperone FlgA [Roseovarius autotrophicus]|uniref:flagellar basal body P-ring formation chaperone FlgA n=1 Tax=Roseovarius autotrophicus TaxID=2824121 RepID=UPI001A0E1C72|nr:flagellar basal body P-ring formation chaperone FlgA [Roseovarius autotrophicus]MBE0454789.1 flagellar basal body P-ring formation protein FlgA [Roseovarius sp.]
MRRLVAILAVMAAPALADRVEAVRVIRPQEIIAPEDVILRAGPGTGAPALDAIIGQEARVALYPGRAIRAGDFGPPASIERNQVVPLIYTHGGLRIETEGRALVRAGVGEYVRVMNLASRTTITGRVTADGRIEVSR